MTWLLAGWPDGIESSEAGSIFCDGRLAGDGFSSATDDWRATRVSNTAVNTSTRWSVAVVVTMRSRKASRSPDAKIAPSTDFLQLPIELPKVSVLEDFVVQLQRLAEEFLAFQIDCVRNEKNGFGG